MPNPWLPGPPASCLPFARCCLAGSELGRRSGLNWRWGHVTKQLLSVISPCPLTGPRCCRWACGHLSGRGLGLGSPAREHQALGSICRLPLGEKPEAESASPGPWEAAGPSAAEAGLLCSGRQLCQGGRGGGYHGSCPPGGPGLRDGRAGVSTLRTQHSGLCSGVSPPSCVPSCF